MLNHLIPLCEDGLVFCGLSKDLLQEDIFVSVGDILSYTFDSVEDGFYRFCESKSNLKKIEIAYFDNGNNIDDAPVNKEVMAEIAMTCESDIRLLSKRSGLTKEAIKNVLNTSLYLFEQHKGSDNAVEKPEKMFPQAMGYLAHFYLTYDYLHDSQGQRNRSDLFESMDIQSADDFEHFGYIAKASHNWFKFSYCG